MPDEGNPPVFCQRLEVASALNNQGTWGESLWHPSVMENSRLRSGVVGSGSGGPSSLHFLLATCVLSVSFFKKNLYPHLRIFFIAFFGRRETEEGRERSIDVREKR